MIKKIFFLLIFTAHIVQAGSKEEELFVNFYSSDSYGVHSQSALALEVNNNTNTPMSRKKVSPVSALYNGLENEGISKKAFRYFWTGKSNIADDSSSGSPRTLSEVKNCCVLKILCGCCCIHRK